MQIHDLLMYSHVLLFIHALACSVSLGLLFFYRELNTTLTNSKKRGEAKMFYLILFCFLRAIFFLV